MRMFLLTAFLAARRRFSIVLSLEPSTDRGLSFRVDKQSVVQHWTPSPTSGGYDIVSLLRAQAAHIFTSRTPAPAPPPSLQKNCLCRITPSLRREVLMLPLKQIMAAAICVQTPTCTQCQPCGRRDTPCPGNEMCWPPPPSSA